MPHLAAASVILQSLAQAPGTWRNKNTHVAQFEAFCESFNITSSPPEPDTLVLYTTYLAVVRFLSLGTIKNHLASLRTYHAAHGLALPAPTQYQPLHLALRGVRRFLARPANQKLPITKPIMSLLLAQCPTADPQRCLYLFLYLTFLRLSSVMPTTTPFVFTPLLNLSWANLLLQADGLSINITHTKTIVCLERTLRFFIPPHRNRSVCLLSHVADLLLLPGYPSQPLDPVFNVWDGAAWVPMVRSNAQRPFRQHLANIGLDPKLFGWSSFRRGPASEYLLATNDTELLRLHGDWRSEVWRSYLAIPAERRSVVASTLQDLF